MQPHFSFVVAMVFILTSALGAPIEDACLDVQISSSRLNKIARTLSIEPCIMKMSAVLRSYHSEVEKVGKLPDCAKLTELQQAMHKFYTDMRKCATATRQLHIPEFVVTATHHGGEDYGVEDNMWHATDLCNYTVERVFSFSILAARVFASGDPAKHGHGSAAQCV
ncbi:hypothetical protein NHX12_012449 [Muraenolepis orangiensis]|uniref:Secreted protein n=1 Tax=Muraenolepis orangiensis TaxID=630683 RepID=A0A9Q0I5X4_9TELE|nr:hypothetical protein NHX12_012449 [Muraenolepis orangiensis]